MKNNNKGFSLVELLIALAVSGVILTGLALLVTQSVNSYTRQAIVSQLQNECDMTLNQIGTAVMEADGIYITCGMTYDADYSSKTVGTAYGIYTKYINDSTYKPEGYVLDGDTLKYQDSSGQLSEVTDYVESFKCYYDYDSFDSTADRIDKIDKKVRVVVEITMKKHNITRTVRRTFETRNNVGDKIVVDLHTVKTEDVMEGGINVEKKSALSSPTTLAVGMYLNELSEYIYKG